MSILTGTPMRETADPTVQSSTAAQLAALQHHKSEVQLHASDIRVQLEQLREQQALASPQDRLQFNGALATAQHEYTATMLDYDATIAKIGALEKADQGGAAATVQPPSDRLLDRSQLDKAGVGLFLLMIPIVFALARRIWVRGASTQPMYDLESSPRLQRLEEAVEAIAIEVERIGEAERFSAKLLSERRPAPDALPSARREPGTITPH